jgi:predicted metal-dependent hydrolase
MSARQDDSHDARADRGNYAWRKGVKLFNAGRYFEAHEQWERLWRLSMGPDRAFYQAIIQAAAALIHLTRGNERGARSLWAKASRGLAHPAGHGKSVGIEQLRADIEACFRRWPTTHELQPRPRIRRKRRPAAETASSQENPADRGKSHLK